MFTHINIVFDSSLDNGGSQDKTKSAPAKKDGVMVYPHDQFDEFIEMLDNKMKRYSETLNVFRSQNDPNTRQRYTVATRRPVCDGDLALGVGTEVVEMLEPAETEDQKDSKDKRWNMIKFQLGVCLKSSVVGHAAKLIKLMPDADPHAIIAKLREHYSKQKKTEVQLDQAWLNNFEVRGHYEFRSKMQEFYRRQFNVEEEQGKDKVDDESVKQNIIKGICHLDGFQHVQSVHHLVEGSHEDWRAFHHKMQSIAEASNVVYQHTKTRRTKGTQRRWSRQEQADGRVFSVKTDKKTKQLKCSNCKKKGHLYFDCKQPWTEQSKQKKAEWDRKQAEKAGARNTSDRQVSFSMTQTDGRNGKKAKMHMVIALKNDEAQVIEDDNDKVVGATATDDLQAQHTVESDSGFYDYCIKEGLPFLAKRYKDCDTPGGFLEYCMDRGFDSMANVYLIWASKAKHEDTAPVHVKAKMLRTYEARVCDRSKQERDLKAGDNVIEFNMDSASDITTINDEGHIQNNTKVNYSAEGVTGNPVHISEAGEIKGKIETTDGNFIPGELTALLTPQFQANLMSAAQVLDTGGCVWLEKGNCYFHIGDSRRPQDRLRLEERGKGFIVKLHLTEFSVKDTKAQAGEQETEEKDEKDKPSDITDIFGDLSEDDSSLEHFGIGAFSEDENEGEDGETTKRRKCHD